MFVFLQISGRFGPTHVTTDTSERRYRFTKITARDEGACTKMSMCTPRGWTIQAVIVSAPLFWKTTALSRKS